MRPLIFIVLVVALIGLPIFWFSGGRNLLPMPYDQKKIEAVPFQTVFRVVDAGQTRKDGGPMRYHWAVEATTHTHGAHGAALIDIGDVRIAIAGWHPRGSQGRSAVQVDTDRPSDPAASSSGMTGSGSFSFATAEQGGVVTCTATAPGSPNVTFTVQKMQLNIAGQAVSLGQGNTVVHVTAQGAIDKITNLNKKAVLLQRRSPSDPNRDEPEARSDRGTQKTP
ncbi:MAG: hypothetical protein AAF581_23720 [Planctomycetota bacterium]